MQLDDVDIAAALRKRAKKKYSKTDYLINPSLCEDCIYRCPDKSTTANRCDYIVITGKAKPRNEIMYDFCEAKVVEDKKNEKIVTKRLNNGVLKRCLKEDV